MTKVDRREFVQVSAVATAALVAAPWRRALAAAASVPTAGGMPGADLVDVSGSDPVQMVAAALNALGGIGRFVRKGDVVVIKPNAGFANPPDWGTTTHPRTVYAVAKACLDAGARSVTVLDYPQAKADKCFKRCGITDALAALPKAQLRLLGKQSEFKKVPVKQGLALKEVEVAKQVLSADVLINLPAAKHHTETGVSFGLKNAMGLIWDRKAFHTMFDLHQGIADLGRVIKPQLTIVDATRALLSGGPAGPGETVTPGRMIAGVQIASVDAYALTVARFNQRQMTPDDARHIGLAGKLGLGEVDVAKLQVIKVTA
ncbi:MAG: DUF362 domain-containing protein [Deltaproteobacteria bacterium]|nr:DUF362 domain-containing protein [Deltaproteobacteria bacterium]